MLRLLLDKDRVFKRLTLKAYEIPIECVIFGGAASLPKSNLCIFPPLILLNDMNINIPLFSALWSSHINFLSSSAISTPCKNISVLALPRQKRENYIPNDRIIPYSDEFCDWTKQQVNGFVLRTDEICDLFEQVRIINSSRTIVLDYGSSFLFNGSLAQNSLIIVVNGTLLAFPSLQSMEKWMISRGNRIVYVNDLLQAKLFIK